MSAQIKTLWADSLAQKALSIFQQKTMAKGRARRSAFRLFGFVDWQGRGLERKDFA